MLSRVHGISVDEAFEMLRDYSRTSGHKLGQVAHAVISERARVPGLIGPPPGPTAAGS